MVLKEKTYLENVTSKLSNNNYLLYGFIANDESVFKQLSTSIKDLNENISQSFENAKSVFHFFQKIGDFFKEAVYWITHPSLFLDTIQPWIMIALMIMILLKVLGFNVDKWFRLVFLILILSIIF